MNNRRAELTHSVLVFFIVSFFFFVVGVRTVSMLNMNRINSIIETVLYLKVGVGVVERAAFNELRYSF